MGDNREKRKRMENVLEFCTAREGETTQVSRRVHLQSDGVRGASVNPNDEPLQICGKDL
ncbi:hypothetical protein KIN20_026274 [Parelaphostrongylus tenuis]|uniref:Uncharacterized protein n=1 Tax=Parelaphostrongylus tenuis TaxID=148309 RepID=A0AAD5QUZ5_PARTN|nr:hypothetical protein KIN20_026274 [Parelaphostrongylus tenuis]